MATLSASTPNTIQGTSSQRQQCFDVKVKRSRPKTVTWADNDKLNQIRLFAAEDAPSLSGSVLQEFLEAKKSKFMHTLIPVSAHDLPPGFESIPTKRTKLDTSAVPTMVSQIQWRCPEKFLYDPSWQVASGDESSEGASQAQRDVRVLEAFYPRPTTIPASSVETQEIPAQLDESQVPHIPMIPIEDEEEGVGDDYTLGEAGSGIVKPLSSSQDLDMKVHLSYPPGYSPNREDQYLDQLGDQPPSRTLSPSSSAEAHSNTDFSTSFDNNSDPDVAAAAAAAYAVLKAKESGALIDHDLLIKILSNPLLVKTLTASNPSLSNQFGNIFASTPSVRDNGNGNGLKTSLQPFEEYFTHMMPGRQRYDHPLEGKSKLGFSVNPTTSHMWGLNANSNTLLNRFLMGGGHEQVNTSKGMVAYGSLGRSYSFPGQDMARDLQHGMVCPEPPQIRQNGVPLSFEEATVGGNDKLGNPQPWLGNSSSSSISVLSNTRNAPLDRPPTAKKQCFFFNTAKGCRNGTFCNFAHGVLSNKPPHLERTNSDIEQIHDSKLETSTGTM